MSGEKIRHFDHKNNAKNKLPNNRVRQIIKAKYGRIWIATYSGIEIVSEGSSKTIKRNQYNQLPHNSICSLFLDSVGNI